MKIQFSKKAVLLGSAFGFAATLAMIFFATLYSSPGYLVFLFPAFLLWILIPAILMKMVEKFGKR